MSDQQRQLTVAARVARLLCNKETFIWRPVGVVDVSFHQVSQPGVSWG